MKTKTSVFLLIFAVFAPLHAAEFQFVVYADVQRSESNHQKLAGIISGMPETPEFAVCCGDMAGMTNGSVAPADAWDTFLGNAQNLGVPFWPAKGNHDGGEDTTTLRNFGNAMSFIRSRSQYNGGSPDNDYYSFTYNNCLFVVLNNMGSSSSMKPGQKTWLASEVAQDRAKNADHIFVFQHYAVLEPGKPESDREHYSFWRTYIGPYFEPMPNFSGLFWGDVHYFWKGSYKGVTGMAVPPTTSSRPEPSLNADELGGSFSGYFVVSVKGDSVTAKAYDYDETEKAGWIIKAGSSTGLTHGPIPAETGLRLTASPNPFTATARISVRGAAHPQIFIYAIDGRRVARPALQRTDGGYMAEWSAGGARPGVYLLRLEAGGKKRSRRLVLCK